MIYTLTLNPAIDYIVSLSKLVPGDINRSTGELFFPGGKGINVSHLLHNLGFDSRILGFAAGSTGELLLSMLQEADLSQDMLKASGGNTRLNICIRALDDNHEETEITGIGPLVTDTDLENLYRQLDALVPGDTLVMSGSIPPSVPATIYADIMTYLADKDVRIVVDAARSILMNVLSLKPFLIKPNHHELGELFDVKLTTREEVIPYAQRLQEMGAQNVLISLAGEGAVLIAADGTIYSSAAPKGKVKNSIGAGDSMVAGFVYGYETTQDYREALRYGLASGSGSAFSDGFASRELILQLHDEITL